MRKFFYVNCAGTQWWYWIYYGVINCFASAFLLARGYSNTDIGLILAAGNITAVILQPVLADIADRARRISVFGVAETATVAMMALTIGLFLLHYKSVTLTVIYVLLLGGQMALQPLINTFTFKMEEIGVSISFSITRSMGSIGYAIMCVVLGVMVERAGESALTVTGEVVLVLLLAFLMAISIRFRREKSQSEAGEGTGKDKCADSGRESGEDEKQINLIDFIKGNKVFFVMTLGVIGLYIANAVQNNFMLQIITPLGGNSEDMGRILSVMGLCELPTMFLFDRIHRRFRCETLLKTAAIMYVIKIAVTWMAGSVQVVLISQLLQMGGFALFLPSMVHFIDSIMRSGEAVKGQALFTTMTTVAGILSSLIGGVILDAAGAGALLVMATICAAAGAAVIILTVGHIRKRD